jgi:DNA invertase Pin-like site-specific DNA recombinase
MDQSTAMQTDELIDYCNARKATFYEVFMDEGYSGSTESRPRLNALMEGLRKRKFDAVLVWRVDRFSRSLSHLVRSLDEFRDMGIDFISFKENMDTTTPTGKLMFSLISSFAEFERNIIKERVIAGLAKARRNGKILGRPRKVFLHMDDINNYKKAGLSNRQIAQKHNVSLSSIRNIIRKASSS